MKRKEQNNSVFSRIRRSKYQTLYGTVWFLLMYSLLLYVGSRVLFVVGKLCEYEDGAKWLFILVVGLIIMASSLLGKMFYSWLRERRNNCRENNEVK